MKVIDLSQTIFDGMPVYPGDPEVEIKQVLHLKKDEWNMETIFLPTHIATHVNIPIHGVQGGKHLDELPVEVFWGKSVIVSSMKEMKPGCGWLFLDKEKLCSIEVKRIRNFRPKFVGIEGYFESEAELRLEKELLNLGVISYEGLVNLDKLPKGRPFQFYGFPLKIKNGFGSPVRAVAIV